MTPRYVPLRLDSYEGDDTSLTIGKYGSETFMWVIVDTQTWTVDDYGYRSREEALEAIAASELAEGRQA